MEKINRLGQLGIAKDGKYFKYVEGKHGLVRQPISEETFERLLKEEGLKVVVDDRGKPILRKGKKVKIGTIERLAPKKKIHEDKMKLESREDSRKMIMDGYTNYDIVKMLKQKMKLKKKAK